MSERSCAVLGLDADPKASSACAAPDAPSSSRAAATPDCISATSDFFSTSVAGEAT